MKLEKDYYTTDISETYWFVIPRYRNEEYTKCKIAMYYKYGEYKGCPVDTSNFKIYHKNITHWKKYVDKD